MKPSSHFQQHIRRRVFHLNLWACLTEQGHAGEQWTMFFKDPSGNNLEFKAMTNPSNLFAKYNVDEYDYLDEKHEGNVLDDL